MTAETAAPPIDATAEEWRIVSAILQKHIPGRAVWAFGSRARGTARPYSDLDIVILGAQPLSLATSASLKDDFSESDLPWKVDVVDWATATGSFRGIIEQDKVVIQNADEHSTQRC